MRQQHTPAAVALEAQRIQSIPAHTHSDKVKGCGGAHPSVYSACRRPRYDSHLLPITFPHVKHRIGIIMATSWILLSAFRATPVV